MGATWVNIERDFVRKSGEPDHVKRNLRNLTPSLPVARRQPAQTKPPTEEKQTGNHSHHAETVPQHNRTFSSFPSPH